MKWQTTSTDTPRDIAGRFARETFPRRYGEDGPWFPAEVDGATFRTEAAAADRPVRALFRLTNDAHQWYELEAGPGGCWTLTSKARPPRRVVHIPLDQVYHEGTPEGGYHTRPRLRGYHTRARLLVAGVNDFPGFSLGIIREGQSGRKVYQGPLVPGPWAFASGHATVIDNHGGTRGDIDREQAEGRVYTVEPGDVLEIDGCHFQIGLAPHRNITLTLVPTRAA